MKTLATIVLAIALFGATVTATHGVTITPATTTNETNSAICSLPVDEGNCLSRDNSTKWYYDVATQQCRQFKYSGCGGNDNRFDLYEECFRICPVLPTDSCQHPIYTGLCKGNFPHWGYNEVSRECEQFVYGGCGKNGNNFETYEACSSTCIAVSDQALSIMTMCYMCSYEAGIEGRDDMCTPDNFNTSMLLVPCLYNGKCYTSNATTAGGVETYTRACTIRDNQPDVSCDDNGVQCCEGTLCNGEGSGTGRAVSLTSMTITATCVLSLIGVKLFD